MYYRCDPVDASFLESAPIVLVESIELDASAEEVFAIFDDEHQWPMWFKDMANVNWTSPRPFKVGTTRIVNFRAHLGGMWLDEYFYRWEDDHRFTFYGVACNYPLVKKVSEDYELVKLAPDRCKFIYTIAMEPRLMLSFKPATTAVFRNMMRRACKGLQQHVRNKKRQES